MTEQDTLMLNKFFTQYGSPTDSISHTLHVYATRSNAIDKLDDIVRADKNAAEQIEQLEKYIVYMKLHRQELANRYNELATAACVPGIKLVREPNSWTKKIKYRITYFTRYLDMEKDVDDRWDIYPGTERREAIKIYNDYVNSHPGIIAIMDIEKRHWEK